MLEAVGIWKAYHGRQVLRDIRFALPQGHCLGVAAPLSWTQWVSLSVTSAMSISMPGTRTGLKRLSLLSLPMAWKMPAGNIPTSESAK